MILIFINSNRTTYKVAWRLTTHRCLPQLSPSLSFSFKLGSLWEQILSCVHETSPISSMLVFRLHRSIIRHWEGTILTSLQCVCATLFFSSSSCHSPPNSHQPVYPLWMDPKELDSSWAEICKGCHSSKGLCHNDSPHFVLPEMNPFSCSLIKSKQQIRISKHLVPAIRVPVMDPHVLNLALAAHPRHVLLLRHRAYFQTHWNNSVIPHGPWISLTKQTVQIAIGQRKPRWNITWTVRFPRPCQLRWLAIGQ